MELLISSQWGNVLVFAHKWLGFLYVGLRNDYKIWVSFKVFDMVWPPISQLYQEIIFQDMWEKQS